MFPDETPGPAFPGEDGDPALVAAAVRAGIDAVLTERAPAERDAFWRAVALHCARPPKRHSQPETPITPNDTEASR